MPPLRQGVADLGFVAACKKLGYHPYPIPAAIASVDYQGRSACVYCGFCHGFPCHVGAKSSTHVTCIARGLATGNLEIRPFARVFRVNRDETGRRVVGVSYFDADGNVQEIEAPTVILAAYALENARLLLASEIDGGGQVGQNLMVHNRGWYTALLPEPTNPFMGPLVGASVIDDVASELVPDNDEGVLWGSPVTSWPGDTQPIEVAHNLPAGLPRWGKEYKDWLRQNYRRLYKTYSQTATFPSKRYYCDLDPKVKDKFGQPALRLTHDWADHDRKAVEFMMKIKRAIGQEMGVIQAWEDPPTPPYHVTTHDVGTHRMGLDPALSVVDPFGEAHCGYPGRPSRRTYLPTIRRRPLARGGRSIPSASAADHSIRRRTAFGGGVLVVSSHIRSLPARKTNRDAGSSCEAPGWRPGGEHRGPSRA